MITACKECGGMEFYFKIVTYANDTQHIQQRCFYCNTFQTNVKQSNEGKSKEDYKKEFLEKEPATDAQVNYLRKLGYHGEVKSKWYAMMLINKYKGE